LSSFFLCFECVQCGQKLSENDPILNPMFAHEFFINYRRFDKRD
jgi:hypothetical protein